MSNVSSINVSFHIRSDGKPFTHVWFCHKNDRYPSNFSNPTPSSMRRVMRWQAAIVLARTEKSK